jgi:pimeloyl-ACP methyl ester carboxylesterase
MPRSRTKATTSRRAIPRSRTKASASRPKPAVAAPQPAQDAVDYWIDAWQRSVLFWDVLRERGNQYLENTRAGNTPVLVFDYQIVVDGRELEQPVNYALARIVPPAGCPAPDATQRPFVVIDPRAGHGPGIGGFKMDSEIGIALRRGHPCYFIMFFPQPVPGQTIERVARAEYHFLEKVGELHPQAQGKPFVIGNCQGGWALMILAAAAPELVGPILLAGSPISYWAGVEGKNPMRYSGGLLGGSWVASLASDLGHGQFDGAYLVNNFEQLNPANTYWTKLYNLYSKVDTERERFLEFERWWGGHYLLNKAEIEWITQNLFVGNRLSAGEVASADGTMRIDLRNIRSPIVVFASWGDNITPPQQALNWIPDLYDSVDEIRLNEQTIVYCLHDNIGHLGIFVSGGVANREHSEIASALDLIDMLPPGLYEAQITDTLPDTPGREYTDGRYSIAFAPRTIDDILKLDDGRKDEEAFEVVARVSQVNQSLYDLFASPWVAALSSGVTAEALRNLNPARVERWVFSDLNPALWPMRTLAAWVRAQRQPVAAGNAFAQAEGRASELIASSLDWYREARDAASERVFKAIYEAPWIAALVGLGPTERARRRRAAPKWLQTEVERLKRQDLERAFEEGTVIDGYARVLVYAGRNETVFDERPFNLVRRLLSDMPAATRPTLAQLKQSLKRQSFLILVDEARAAAGLTALLPTLHERRQAYELARRLARTRGSIAPAHEARFAHLAHVLGLDKPALAVSAG